MVKNQVTIPALIYSLTIVFFSMFLFLPRMHERYLFPVFPLLFFLSAVTRSQAPFIFGLILAPPYLANLYSQWWAPGNTFLQSLYTPDSTRAVSLAYLLAFAMLFKLKWPYADRGDSGTGGRSQDHRS
jgi:hypothetical protein